MSLRRKILTAEGKVMRFAGYFARAKSADTRKIAKRKLIESVKEMDRLHRLYRIEMNECPF